MRAVVVEQTGGPEAMQVVERPAPEPGPGQVTVDVAASGVNFIDVYQRTGAYPKDLPFVVGSEGAGTVTAVGEGVDGVAVGDRVAWAMVDGGGYAEATVLAAERAVRVPDGVDLEVAAAAMLQGMTAHYLCETTFPAGPEHTALVHAAAGGVGLLLTQMLATKGTRVIATTGTEEKAALARAAGADEVVLYRDTDLVEEVRRVTDGDGVHVVYDGVGRTTFDDGLTLLRTRGMMVLYGASSGPVPPMDPQLLNRQGSLFLTRPTLGHYIADRAELLERAGAVLGQVAAGTLDVRIGGRYPLADAGRAHEDLEARRTTGKLLVLPRD
ncbi:quinone oxidoreductase family protein [Nocardioides iriomotensis]|uniref:Quinone oxidoreductase n=1 Tax=Nocardioides iriomotensis TaxID=715784 RepID=A0A4Q5J5B5_9ACTN|nr:quinone oxidoreductase [Nocardioides iriomotensis]RYU13038.1 quinone oxidoreductase [Nocardioides iriomotensis]